jgi:hypothetical protein
MFEEGEYRFTRSSRSSRRKSNLPPSALSAPPREKKIRLEVTLARRFRARGARKNLSETVVLSFFSAFLRGRVGFLPRLRGPYEDFSLKKHFVCNKSGWIAKLRM